MPCGCKKNREPPKAVGGVICDLFSCYHLDGGPMEKVQNFITPNDPEVQKLAKDLDCDYRLLFEFVRDIPYEVPKNDYWRYPAETLKDMRGDCLTGDTEIITLRDGDYYIETMKELYKNPDCLALSYSFEDQNFEFQPITQVMDKGKKEVFEISLRNGTSLRCTADHKLFVYNSRWKGQNKGKNNMLVGRYGKKWTKQKAITNKIRIMSLSNLKEDMSSIVEGFYRKLIQAKKIPAIGKDGVSKNQLWLEGMYVAEGWKYGSQVCIANDAPLVLLDIEEKLSGLGVSFKRSKRKKHAYINIHSSQFKEHLKKFGATSKDKRFINERLSLSEENMKILLEGYTKGDGHLNKPYGVWNRKYTYNRKRTYMTTSFELIKQLKVMSMILGRHFNYYSPQKPSGYGKLKQHYIFEYNHKRTHREIYPSLVSESIKNIEKIDTERVYDITVARNHNFILANTGTVIHNCLDKSVLLTSAFLRCGINSWVVLGYVPKDDIFHAFTEALIDNQVKIFETTCAHCRAGQLPKNFNIIRLLDFDDKSFIRYD